MVGIVIVIATTEEEIQDTVFLTRFRLFRDPISLCGAQSSLTAVL